MQLHTSIRRLHAVGRLRAHADVRVSNAGYASGGSNDRARKSRRATVGLCHKHESLTACRIMPCESFAALMNTAAHGRRDGRGNPRLQSGALRQGQPWVTREFAQTTRCRGRDVSARADLEAQSEHFVVQPICPRCTQPRAGAVAPGFSGKKLSCVGAAAASAATFCRIPCMTLITSCQFEASTSGS